MVPVIEQIRAKTDAPLSIDTRKAAVARAALEAGADVVNDVTAGRFDAGMFETISRSRAGAILMHMKGTDPRTMQDDCNTAIWSARSPPSWRTRRDAPRRPALRPRRIAVDPGLGFGKAPEDNLVLLRHLAAFRSLGLPVAAGASRKGFIRRFSGVPENASAGDRLPGSLAAIGAAAAGGAVLLRVHDVADSVRYLRMMGAITRTAGSVVTAGSAAR